MDSTAQLPAYCPWLGTKNTLFFHLFIHPGSRRSCLAPGVKVQGAARKADGLCQQCWPLRRVLLLILEKEKADGRCLRAVSWIWEHGERKYFNLPRMMMVSVRCRDWCTGSAKAFHGPGEAKPCLGATANTLLVTQGAEQLLHQHSQTQWDGRGTLGPGTPRLRV